MNPFVKSLLGIAAVALLASALVVAVFSARPSAVETVPEISGFVVDEPRALPEFKLLDGDGNPFTPRDFAGAWSFIYFGYTYCPDVCPMSMVEMGRIARTLATDAVDDPVNYYLVSVDPQRDTPEKVGEYAAYFNPAFRGLTGDARQIDLLTTAAGVIYEVPENPQDDNYLVGHSSFITLLNPDGAIHAFFTVDLDGEQIARDFQAILAMQR